ncbi:hypothetical protein [Parathalassolituus penaei]|uniref:Uncharacterized protein n=1 Tax=Parathalassolituus penaei TaxID=2997323 RepID=A0A9X3IUY1_9GAMM|nr:hypothetical protein [Parathalassolituus penaei]MCY0966668.1 hypothetical protein [Parathalassolituus penaei]
MSTEKDTRNLVDELATLQQVLDDAAGEQIDLQHALTQLNTVDDVPVLSDMFSRDEPPILRAVPPLKQQAPIAPLRRSAPVSPASQVTPATPANPGDILEALHQEVMRKAANRALEGESNEDDFTSALEEAILDRHSERILRAVPTLAEALPDDIPVVTAIATTPPHSAATATKPAAPGMISTADVPVVTNRVTTPVRPAAAAPTPVSAQAYNTVKPAAPVPPLMTEPAAPATQAAPTVTAKQTAAEPAKPARSSNPFLPQEVIDRLTQERLAAQHSAEEAHRTMQRVMEKQQARESEAMHRLSSEDKTHLINAIVDEMTPIIQARLREKLRTMLIKKPETPTS